MSPSPGGTGTSGRERGAQKALRPAFKILFKEKLTFSNALDRIEAELPQLPEVKRLVEFARSSERGLCK